MIVMCGACMSFHCFLGPRARHMTDLLESVGCGPKCAAYLGEV